MTEQEVQEILDSVNDTAKKTSIIPCLMCEAQRAGNKEAFEFLKMQDEIHSHVNYELYGFMTSIAGKIDKQLKYAENGDLYLVDKDITSDSTVPTS